MKECHTDNESTLTKVKHCSNVLLNDWKEKHPFFKEGKALSLLFTVAPKCLRLCCHIL